jgi:hypothetical protein
VAQLMQETSNGVWAAVGPNNPLAMGNARAATASLTSVASSATTVQLLAANTARRGVIIYNESTAVLFVKFGTTASNTSYTLQLAANTSWTMADPIYTGRIDGIWAAANGNARITEL